MKNVKLVALAILGLATAHVAYPYAIVNDANSADKVTIYVFKDQDKYLKMLKAQGVPDQVLSYATKISAAAPAIGAALAVPTEGASLLVAAAVPISVQAAKLIVEAMKKTGAMSAAIRKAAGVVAVHTNVAPGNKGRGAEWNWKDIEKEYQIPQGTNMYVVVTDKNNGIPLIQTTIPSNGLLGFTVKKDARGQLYAEESSAAASQYVPSNIQQKEQSTFDKVTGTLTDIFKAR